MFQEATPAYNGRTTSYGSTATNIFQPTAPTNPFLSGQDLPQEYVQPASQDAYTHQQNVNNY